MSKYWYKLCCFFEYVPYAQINIPSEEFDKLKYAFETCDRKNVGKQGRNGCLSCNGCGCLMTARDYFTVFDKALEEVWLMMDTIFNYQYVQQRFTSK